LGIKLIQLAELTSHNFNISFYFNTAAIIQPHKDKLSEKEIVKMKVLEILL